MEEGIIGIQFSEETESESVICIPPEVWDVIKYKFDGHYTLMKFTTNYRFCFGTLAPLDLYKWRMQIEKMSSGKSSDTAMCEELILYEKLGEDMYWEYYDISDDDVFNRWGFRVNCVIQNKEWENAQQK